MFTECRMSNHSSTDSSDPFRHQAHHSSPAMAPSTSLMGSCTQPRVLQPPTCLLYVWTSRVSPLCSTCDSLRMGTVYCSPVPPSFTIFALTHSSQEGSCQLHFPPPITWSLSKLYINLTSKVHEVLLFLMCPLHHSEGM